MVENTFGDEIQGKTANRKEEHTQYQDKERKLSPGDIAFFNGRNKDTCRRQQEKQTKQSPGGEATEQEIVGNKIANKGIEN